MAHGDAREGKWRGNVRMEWVASSLALYVGTWSIHGLSADSHSSTASSRLNWPPRRFKWTRPFCWKTKSGFWACAITFRTCSTMCTSVKPVRQKRVSAAPNLCFLRILLLFIPARTAHLFQPTARTQSNEHDVTVELCLHFPTSFYSCASMSSVSRSFLLHLIALIISANGYIKIFTLSYFLQCT